MNKKLILNIILTVSLVVITGITTASISLITNLEETYSEIVLSEVLIFEVNSEVHLLSLIQYINNGQIISENKLVDTSSLGRKEITINYLNAQDKKNEFSFYITVVDTESPIITIYSNELITTLGTPIDFLQNVQVTDNSGEEIIPTIKGNYSFDLESEYPLKYIAVDSNGNIAKKAFILKVLAVEVSPTNTYKTHSLAFGNSNSRSYLNTSVNNSNIIDNSSNINNDYIPSVDSALVSTRHVDASGLLSLVNTERSNHGLSPLTWSSSLASSAGIRAKESSLVFSHTRPNGTPWYTISSLAFGENLAAGNRNISCTFNQWMNSPTHKANILNPDFRTIGISGYYNPNGYFKHYWVQLFGY